MRGDVKVLDCGLEEPRSCGPNSIDGGKTITKTSITFCFVHGFVQPERFPFYNDSWTENPQLGKNHLAQPPSAVKPHPHPHNKTKHTLHTFHTPS